MHIRLVEPLVCRCPGLPFSQLEALGGPLDGDRLWDQLDDPEVVDCLATMHPAALVTLRSRRGKRRPGKRPSDIRRAELTLYRYLTRFTSRNDTTGTAGTTIWGSQGPGASQVKDVPDGHKTKVVWASPRRAELLAWQAAHGPLRHRARLVVRSGLAWRGDTLIDTHHQQPIAVQDDQAALLQRLVGQDLSYQELQPEEQSAADALVNAGLVTLVLAPTTWDRLDSLLHHAAGSELEAELRELAQLRSQLVQAREDEFARLMAEADERAARLCNSQTLEYAGTLFHLVCQAFDEGAIELMVTPTLRLDGERLVEIWSGRTRRLSPDEHAMISLCRTPCPASALQGQRALAVELLEEGVLTLAGSQEYTTGWPFETRFGDLARALAQAPLSPRLREAVQCLRAARSDEPPQLHPLGAEARLSSLLGEDLEKYLIKDLDRSFFVCDSARDMENFQLGEGLRCELTAQLQPWFRLLAWQDYGRERMLAPLLGALLDDGSSQPLSVVLAQLTTLWRWYQTSSETGLPFALDLRTMQMQAVADDERAWRVHYDAQNDVLTIHEGEVPPAFEAWLQDKRFVSTVDLMMGGSLEQLDRGEGCFLISEAHCGAGGLGETTFFAHSHPQHGLQGHGAQVFGHDTIFLQSLVPTKQTESILCQLQDNVMAVSYPDQGYQHGRTLPIAELTVRREGQRYLVSDGVQSYRLITDLVSFGNVRPVGGTALSLARWAQSKRPAHETSAPQGPVESYPEVRLGRLILARRQVRMPSSVARALCDRSQQATLREQYRLPRFVYVKTFKKPMLCDLDSDLSLEVLLAELEKVQQVSISPMQPGPDELWLTLQGQPYTSEIRMAVTCDGLQFDEGPQGHAFVDTSVPGVSA